MNYIAKFKGMFWKMDAHPNTDSASLSLKTTHTLDIWVKLNPTPYHYKKFGNEIKKNVTCALISCSSFSKTNTNHCNFTVKYQLEKNQIHTNQSNPAAKVFSIAGDMSFAAVIILLSA